MGTAASVDADDRPGPSGARGEPGRLTMIASVLVVGSLAALAVVLVVQAADTEHRRVRAEASTTGQNMGEALEQFLVARIAMLEAIGRTPEVASGDPQRMVPLLEAISSPDLGFEGGVGWMDASGQLLAEAGVDPTTLPIDLSDRTYVQDVLSGGVPVVSDGLRGKLSGEVLVVLAVPVFVDEELSGALIASLRPVDLARSIPILRRYGAVVLLDASRREVYADGEAGSLERVAVPLTTRPEASGAPGSEGATDPNGQVAVATTDRFGWTVVYDPMRDDATGRGVVLQVVLIVAGTVLALGSAAVAFRRADRANRRLRRRNDDLLTLERLAERLARADSIEDVANAALDVIHDRADAPVTVLCLADDDLALSAAFVRLGDEMIDAGFTESWTGISGLCSDALRSRETYVATIAQLEARDEDAGELLSRCGASSGVVLPFTGISARGVVIVGSCRPDPPGAADVELFEAMVLPLADAFGRARASEIERHASRTLQRALLPQDQLGPQHRTVERAARYRPAGAQIDVGGDWFDLFELPGARVGVVVGDVVGRGMQAATIMGKLQSALRAFSFVEQDPGRVLDLLDEFARLVAGAPGATAIFGVLDQARRSFTVASAGHLPPILRRGTETVIVYQIHGRPLGYGEPGYHRGVTTLDLVAGETVLLCTDGLVERRGEVIDVGLERLAEALRAHGDLPVEQCVDALVARCLEPEQQDDVAVVALRLQEATGKVFSAKLQADPAELAPMREQLTEWLDVQDVPTETAEDLVLAVHEAACNAIEHGYADSEGGLVTVELERGADAIQVVVRDDGEWRPPQWDPRRGRGLAIIERVSNRLVVDRLSAGTAVRFDVPIAK